MTDQLVFIEDTRHAISSASMRCPLPSSKRFLAGVPCVTSRIGRSTEPDLWLWQKRHCEGTAHRKFQSVLDGILHTDRYHPEQP